MYRTKKEKMIIENPNEQRLFRIMYSVGVFIFQNTFIVAQIFRWTFSERLSAPRQTTFMDAIVFIILFVILSWLFIQLCDVKLL